MYSNEDVQSSQVRKEEECKPVISDALKTYLKLTEAEKKLWLEFFESLKKRYYDLKRDVKARKKTVVDDVNFLEHLPEEEKEFYNEIQKAKDNFFNVHKDLNKLNDIIFILNYELLNQSDLILQKINVKKQSIELNDLFKDD